MNDKNDTDTRAASPLEHLVRRLRDGCRYDRQSGIVLAWDADDLMDKAADEIERLREVLIEAVDTGGGTRYNGDDDDCGDHACCMTATYEPHAPDCWVTKARALLTPNV